MTHTNQEMGQFFLDSWMIWHMVSFFCMMNILHTHLVCLQNVIFNFLNKNYGFFFKKNKYFCICNIYNVPCVSFLCSTCLVLDTWIFVSCALMSCDLAIHWSRVDTPNLNSLSKSWCLLLFYKFEWSSSNCPIRVFAWFLSSGAP